MAAKDEKDREEGIEDVLGALAMPLGANSLVPGFEGPHETARIYVNHDHTINGPLVAETKGRFPATHETFVPQGQTGRIMGAIASLESGGNVTGAIRYDAIGPLCRSHARGHFAGTPSAALDGHALGGWQVMAENVGPWAREAGLGNVTPEEFLNSPELQRKVVGYQIQKLEAKGYSVENIASIWQSGRPLVAAEGAGARDQNMSTVRYAETVQRHYDELGNMPQVASADLPRDARPTHGNHGAMAVASSRGGAAQHLPAGDQQQIASVDAKSAWQRISSAFTSVV